MTIAQKDLPTVSVFTVSGPEGVVGTCDSRCYNAVVSKCSCVCGGVNHGVGRLKAEENMSFITDDAVIQANRIRTLQGKRPVKIFKTHKQLRLF